MVNRSQIKKASAPQTMMMFGKLSSAKAPRPSEMRVATTSGLTTASAFSTGPSKLNNRLLGPVKGVYEQISRVSLDHYYGGAEHKNASALMDKLLGMPFMWAYKTPYEEIYDKNIVNIVFYSKDVHGELFFFSKIASELAKAPMFSWAEMTDDLDYLFARLAALVRLTYCSNRVTQFCRPKHWEPWPEQPTSVLCAYTMFEKELTSS